MKTFQLTEKITLTEAEGTEEGEFKDFNDDVKTGVAKKYFLDGISDYSLVIEYVTFEDGTGAIGLQDSFVGPMFIFDELYGRLRIGVNTHINMQWCEIRVPAKSISGKGRYTAQMVDLNSLDDKCFFKEVEQVLKDNGVIDLDSRAKVVDDESNRKNQLAASWSPDETLLPGLIFTLVRIIPMLNFMGKEANPKQKLTIQFSPYEESPKSSVASLDELLTRDENSDCEFKKSCFFSAKEETYGEKITKDIERTVVGMLNGSVKANLIIGIGKKGEKIGIAKDYKYLKGFGVSNWDKYLTQIRNELINGIGLGPITNFISIKWEDIGEGIENPVCRISISPVPDNANPVTDRDGVVWVRSINGTQKPFNDEELLEYWKNRDIK